MTPIFLPFSLPFFPPFIFFSHFLYSLFHCLFELFGIITANFVVSIVIREEIRFIEEGLMDKANNPIKVHFVLNHLKLLHLLLIEREWNYCKPFLDLPFNNVRSLHGQVLSLRRSFEERFI